METITVNRPTAIIDWSEAQNNFLPEGNSATFQNGSGITDYAVLNRIFTFNGDPVQFNGTVQSRIDGQPGGTVIFQSRGGIILGPTALFDVGSLVLTTLSLQGIEDGYGNLVDFTPDNYQFVDNDGSGDIVTQAGSQIRATADGSYVALVAPTISHGGSVYVNGSAAYIGARQVSFAINEGLFDIIVESGSFAEVPITHSGSTGGPASTGAADPHRIYMITQPSSSFGAVEMLLSGSVGFDDAVSATVENGQIILSAGFDIENGALSENAILAESNIRITGGDFSSDVVARATSDVIVESRDAALLFEGDLTIEAFREARLSALNDAVDVEGDLSLTAFGPLEFGYGSSFGIGVLGLDLTGGSASITAENGQSLTIAGDAALNSSAVGEFDNPDDLDAGDGIGGSVTVSANGVGSSILVDGNLDMRATGQGAETDYVPNTGGVGQGGTARIAASDGAGVRVVGGATVDVSGTGSRSNGDSGTQTGAEGRGGTIDIFASGGASSVSIEGANSFTARGTGGAIEDAVSVEASGGFGQGGLFFMNANNGTVTLGPSTSIDLSAQGAAGPFAGSGFGGSVFVNATANGTALLGATANILADGTGGLGISNGGDGDGGNVGITAQGASARAGGFTVTISADGTGGAGTRDGGAGDGGFVRLAAIAEDGAIEFGNVSATAIGTGGAGGGSGGEAGAGDGGTLFAGTELGYGSATSTATATFGSISFTADGLGGAGTGNGAIGTGGLARIEAQVGQVSFGGSNNLQARGVGGAAGALAGGVGEGGTVRIRAATGATMTAALGSSTLDASGTGGAGGTGLGTGGLGQGGTASIESTGGSMTLDGSFEVRADGIGGVASLADPPVGIGGSGLGGQIFVQAFPNGQVQVGGMTLSVSGQGGNGILGGNGTGGDIEMAALSNGTLRTGNVAAAADGSGGDSRDTQNGGTGTGGDVRLVADAVGGTLVLGNVTATARGAGGEGGVAGGLGDGGDLFAGIELGYGGGGSTVSATFGNLSLDASGTGGSGGTGAGGGGTGGLAFASAPIGSMTIGGGSALTANGTGGSGGTTGGDGTGGQANFRIEGDAIGTGTAGAMRVSAIGRGGNGVAGGNGRGGIARTGTDGGQLTLAGSVDLDASGFGGAGTTGAGGAGTGGLAELYAVNDAPLTFGSASLAADGTGGSGTTGGIGTGGQDPDPFAPPAGGAAVSVAGGSLTGGAIIQSARGIGGAGTAGNGGAGIAGSARLQSLNRPTGSLIDIASASLDVSAIGGQGTGGAGGDATGGTIAAFAQTLNGVIRVDSFSGSANATGGGGTSGGDARGGDAQVGTVSGNETEGAVVGAGEFGTIVVTASAAGGAGTTGAGGDGTGGDAILLGQGSTFTATSASLAADGVGGNSAGGAGGSGAGGGTIALLTPRFQTGEPVEATIGALALASTGTAGTGATAGGSRHGLATLTVEGSTAQFGSIDIIVGGDQPPLDSALAGPAAIRSISSQVTVTGDIRIASTSGVEIAADGGTLDLAGVASISTTQNALLDVTGTGVISGGTWNLEAGGDIAVLHTDSVAGSPTIDVASLTASAGGDVSTVPGTVIRASGAMLIEAAGTASLSGSLLGGAIEVRGGDIDIASADGTTIDLDAVNELTAGDLTATGGITFAAGGAASFDSVDAGGRFGGSAATLALPDVTASEIDVTATSGGASLGTLAGATSLAVGAFGDVTFASLTGGDIAVTSSEGGIAGTSASGAAILFDAAQTASFSGTIVGTEIRVTSNDIAIGDSARLGNADTELVRLQARQTGQQTVIGGSAQGPGYTLTNTEAGRIRTAALEIIAGQTGTAANRPADLVVRDLSVSATPTPAGSGVGNLSIALTAGEGGGSGIISVEGALAMSNAGANNGITLAAPGGRVQIVNPQGSIRVLGSGGLPAGNLEIEAANIWSASQSIIDQLAGNPSFAGRDDALMANNGTTQERGYIEGGEILLRVGSSLLVQNSGTADEFAGITVVQNTLTIEPTSSGQIDVFAFGRRINADGTFVVNSPYFREVEFGDRARYLAAASFNDCTIATGVCAGDVPPGLPVGSEVIEGPIEETEESTPPPNPDRQEFVDVSFATESLLEEPVTSGGDSGVWESPEDCPPGEVCEPGGGGNP
ncbi:hypothetical protein RCO27_13335 [Sphingosinicella sp. LHD-64]|uniref:beta strand repeat-containing protein n=1 Tax=Sphingosinicella sp. LHD-64 TaxID=3072139 RepID=UPI00280EFCB2|nr:hypothetical protein [Sphingosinicella sp. LHD-64]MDQ8757209.1 hypothetical protein [Sphingosinicella sp. LHD-64]